MTAWRRNRAHSLLRAERQNDDIRRSFGTDLRRARGWCLDADAESWRDASFEVRFMKAWMELRDDMQRVLGLGKSLERILADDPSSFEHAVERLVALEKQVDDYMSHQLDHRCLCRSPKGFAWFLSAEPSSKIEGRWMNHCGNTANPHKGDRLVSLREKILEQGVPCWRPRLTGVLDSRGWLVELKGESNTKPNWKYHYLIAWLLAQPEVKGVGTGLRSVPEMDFRWWHLSEELRWWVLDYRPNLQGLNYGDQEVPLSWLQGQRPPPPPPPPGWRDHLQTLFEGVKFATVAFCIFSICTLLVCAPVAILDRLLGR